MSYNSKPGAIDLLLIYRGLCSLGVLLAHAITTMPKYNILEWVNHGPDGLSPSVESLIRSFWPVTGGNYVYVFFILSGYLMGKIYWTKQYNLNVQSTMRFYKNRILRIAPLLYFNLLVCVSLGGGFMAVVSNPLALIGDLFFFNNLSGRVVNAVTWSISFEMQDYLICPIFFLVFRKKTVSSLLWCWITVILLAAYSYYAQQHSSWSILCLAQFTWLFLSGYSVNMIIRILHEDLGVTIGQWARALTFAVYLCCHLVFYYLTNRTDHFFLAQVQLQLMTMLLIVLAELPHKPQDSAATLGGRKVLGFILTSLTWLGRISYGVYLWHAPIATSLHGNSKIVELLAARVNGWGGLNELARLTLVNIGFAVLLVVLTLLLSVSTFFLVELRFRPSLYMPEANTSR